MAHRYIMRIDLSQQARKKLDVLSDRHGMTQVAMMSRLVEWLAKQGPAIQSDVVRNYSGSEANESGRRIIKRMAGEKA